MSGNFWAMGGYATYVWGSYAAGLAVFIWNLVVPRVTRSSVLARLRSGAEE